MIPLIHKAQNISKVKQFGEQSKLRLQTRIQEDNFNQLILQKQKQVYQKFKDFDKMDQLSCETGIETKSQFSRLIDQLALENERKVEQMARMREQPDFNLEEYQKSTNFTTGFFKSTQKSNNDQTQSSNALKSPVKFQSTMNSTFSTLRSSFNPDLLHETIQMTKYDEENVNQMIYMSQETEESLEQRIDQLKFTIGKIKREMKDYEKEEGLLNKKLEQIQDQELYAHKKKNIVKLTVQNYKKEIEFDHQRASQCIKDVKDVRDNILEQIKKESQAYSHILVKIDECKKQLEVQNQEILFLDNRNEDICQKLYESKSTLGYIDSLIELERMFLKGGIEIFQQLPTNTEDQDQQPLSQRSQSSQLGSTLTNRKNNDTSFEKEAQSSLTTSNKKIGSRNKFIQILTSKEFGENNRQNLISKIDIYYNEHGKGPDEIVGYLIKQYREFNLNSQSLQNLYEQLIHNKNTKSAELSDLNTYIDQIKQSVGFNNTFCEDYEQFSNLIPFQDKSVVTDLPRNNIDVPISLLQEFQDNGAISYLNQIELKQQKDALSFRFFHNMIEILYRYICLLKLVIMKHRNPDQEIVDFYDEYSKFICIFRLGMNAKRDNNIDPSKYVNEIFQNMSEQFNDIMKELKIENANKISREEEQQRKDNERFIEKLNFIPFNKVELEIIFKSIFPSATQAHLNNWNRLIKKDYEDFLKEIKMKCSNEEEQIESVFESIHELQDKAYSQHFQNIETVFLVFQKFRELLETKKKQLFDECNHQVQENFMNPTFQTKIYSDQMKSYTKIVADKQDKYFNFQGEIQDPITLKSTVNNTNKTLIRENSNEKSTKDEAKKLIYKLTKNERKKKLDKLNQEIKEHNCTLANGTDDLSKTNEIPSFLSLEDDGYPEHNQINKQATQNEYDFLDKERKKGKYLMQIESKDYNKQIEDQLQRQKDLEKAKSNSSKPLINELFPEVNPRSSHFNRYKDKSNTIYTNIIQQNKIISKLNLLHNKQDKFTNSTIFTKIKDYCPKSKHYFSSNANMSQEQQQEEDQSFSARSRLSLQRGSDLYFSSFFEQKSQFDPQSNQKNNKQKLGKDTIFENSSNSASRSLSKTQKKLRQINSQCSIGNIKPKGSVPNIQARHSQENINKFMAAEIKERHRSFSQKEKQKKSISNKTYYHFAPSFASTNISSKNIPQKKPNQLSMHQSHRRLEETKIQRKHMDAQNNEVRVKKSKSFTKNKPLVIFDNGQNWNSNILPKVTKRGDSLEQGLYHSPYISNSSNNNNFEKTFNTTGDYSYALNQQITMQQFSQQQFRDETTPFNLIDGNHQKRSILINKFNA